MSPFIVAKFGGTSVQNIQAMKKSAVIAHQENAHIVVVSATSGTTNKLIEIMRLGELGKKKEARLLAQEIISFHHSLATEIELPEPSYRELKALFSEIESMAEGFSLLKEVSPKAHDYFVGQGERMSSILFHHVFELETKKSVSLLDSRDFIKTDSLFGKGTPLLEEITKYCGSLKPDKLYVAQGFIASDLNGTPTILGRGGSDYSAALYAYGVKAKELQIWTDVSGIATIDPRLYKNARPMNEITYSEASELASFGAKVLHPRTLNPLWNSETLISVKNTMDPKAPGTVIKRNTSSTPFMRGIAVKRKQRLITLTNPNMLHNYGFLAKIFSLFDQFHVSVDTVITSEISVSLTLDESDALTPNLLDELEKNCHVQQEANLCLVSMIGNHINTTKGMAFHVFDVLKDFNIRMINQGASAHNFCFMIKDEETENVVSKLHQKFLRIVNLAELNARTFSTFIFSKFRHNIMMMKFGFLTLLFVLVACNYQVNKEVFSGGSFVEPMSANGTVGLSYRVNQTAIDFHQFSSLLSDLKNVDETLLPNSWPKLNLQELTKAFCYIHKEDNCSLPVISFNLVEEIN